VHVLPPLVEPAVQLPDATDRGRALVIGQPLTGFELMSQGDLTAVTGEIRAWLATHGFDAIDYKGHPKDAQRELSHPDYRVITPEQALEVFMAGTHYDAVVGVRSSALLFARQIYPATTPVEAFGWSRVRFKSAAERQDMEHTFAAVGVAIHP
jgi:hypothetical protein